MRRFIALLSTITGALLGTLLTFEALLIPAFMVCGKSLGCPSLLPSLLFFDTVLLWIFVFIGLISFFISYRFYILGYTLQLWAGWGMVICGIGHILIIFHPLSTFGLAALLVLLVSAAPGLAYILSSRLIQRAR